MTLLLPSSVKLEIHICSIILINTSAKDLGVTVSKDLKWTEYIAQMVSKSGLELGGGLLAKYQ